MTRASGPNILLILVDDMSVNGISSYGDKPWKTPHIDRLAENGMRFTEAYAYPVCSPTRAALLTGRNPVRTGITNWIPGWSERTENPPLLEQPFSHHLALSEYTLAEALRDHGYGTALVGKWHLGDSYLHAPWQQGFEYAYLIAPSNTGNYFVEKQGMNFLSFSRQDKPGRQFITEHFVDQAVRWLDRQTEDRPWFLYFSTHVVHKPIAAKNEMVQKYQARGLPDSNPDSATYAAMHEHMDTAIGRLLDHLRGNGWERNTLVIFLSDNGGREPETDNQPWRGGKGELLEGGIRVPLIFQWPGRIPSGTTATRIAVVDDLYPTLLDLVGAPRPPQTEFDGISLAGTLVGRTDPNPDRILFFHYPHHTANPYGEPSSAIRQGDWKLIHLLKDDQPELYDLATDPGEADNVAAKHPEVTRHLSRELNLWKNNRGIEPLARNPAYDPTKPTLWNGELQAAARDL